MAKGGVVFTKDNEYYTPASVVSYFGVFDYDPATTKEKAQEFGILSYDTIETDGLTKDWTQYKRIWINPPFTKKHDFLKKAQETFKTANNDIYVLFPIEFLTTQRFKDVCGGGKLYVPSGRIKFESGLNKPGRSPAFGSVVLKLQHTNEIEYIDITKLTKYQQEVML